VAGGRSLTTSRFLTKGESKFRFPTLAERRSDGTMLKGSVMYYDGQFDDARMNISLVTTAAMAGATVLNHVEVTKLIKVTLDISLAS